VGKHNSDTMKILLPLLFILLAGCTALPKYNYQSQAGTDPVFIFGDRFGESAIRKSKGSASHFFLDNQIKGVSITFLFEQPCHVAHALN